MNQNIELGEPALAWKYFLEICRIPRPSGHTEAIQAWLLDFAAKNGLEAKQDLAGNVLISKKATPGKEGVPAVVLQSHMDMVCEKNGSSTHDFTKDPIKPWVDGEWLKAEGTTLGADNGIGMAAQLAVLASADLLHGPVECLFTVDEETGLNGAFGLEKHFFTANRLINLDSEDEGELFIGCAGGMNSRFTLHFTHEKAPDTYFYFKVSVKGLAGGHSGDDIDKGRGNANQLLARFLWNEKKATDLRLCDFKGGNLSNAIPREAECVAGVPWQEKESVRVRLNCLQADLEDEYGSAEPNLQLQLESVSQPEQVLAKRDGDRFINALYGCPNGIQAMSLSLPGLVETSLNLASVKPGEHPDEWVVTTSQRSSVESAKYALSDRLEAVFTQAGMTAWHGEGYPGWKPNPASRLLEQVVAVYREQFAAEPKVRAIHAGLECGLFLEKYPSLDMVSFGPTMRGVHSPDERLHIPAVQNFWTLLVETLARI